MLIASSMDEEPVVFDRLSFIIQGSWKRCQRERATVFGGRFAEMKQTRSGGLATPTETGLLRVVLLPFVEVCVFVWVFVVLST